MVYKLTESGIETIKSYIIELKAKRKEILDAMKDTANETFIPTEEDIISDIDWFIDLDDTDEVCYYNCWGVTDNYDADTPLALYVGHDIVIDNEAEK